MRNAWVLLLFMAAPALAQSEVWVGVDHQELRFDDWLEVHAAVKVGSVIGRIARAERFDVEDVQADVEWYPKLTPKTYVFVSGGVSRDSLLYPDWRAGAELYHAFGKGWEASAGYRRLEFDEGVDLFTASLGRYVGAWLIGGRIYDARETTWQATARRFSGDEGSYWGLRFGVARDEIRSGADLEVFDSPEAVAEVFHVFPSRMLVRARAGVTGLGEEEGLTAALAIGRRF